MRWMPLIAAVALSGFLQAQSPSANPAHVTNTPFARDGTPVDVDLPSELHMKNTGGSDGPRGPGSGSGLCVFTSMEHAARMQNIPVLHGLQHWMTFRPGGAGPAKVDRVLVDYCREKSQPVPSYVQIQANDLETLKAASRSGRLVCVTYSFSPTGRYNRRRILHMVNVAAVGAGQGPDGKGWYCVVDNNYPHEWEWMSESQFMASAAGGKRLWAIIFAAPTAPPAPTLSEG